jgi:TolA-binding protein
LILKITNLEEQLEQFREELENKSEEVQQLHMQLEIQKKESAARLQELGQENKLLKVISLEKLLAVNWFLVFCSFTKYLLNPAVK